MRINAFVVCQEIVPTLLADAGWDARNVLAFIRIPHPAIAILGVMMVVQFEVDECGMPQLVVVEVADQDQKLIGSQQEESTQDVLPGMRPAAATAHFQISLPLRTTGEYTIRVKHGSSTIFECPFPVFIDGH